MAPFGIDASISFVGDVAGDPMEQVLALQSFLPGGEEVEDCVSGQSVFMCVSGMSSQGTNAFE